ncbi:312_t:CDS:2, partial [Ambispora gerdemannii]
TQELAEKMYNGCHTTKKVKEQTARKYNHHIKKKAKQETNWNSNITFDNFDRTISTDCNTMTCNDSNGITFNHLTAPSPNDSDTIIPNDSNSITYNESEHNNQDDDNSEVLLKYDLDEVHEIIAK